MMHNPILKPPTAVWRAHTAFATPLGWRVYAPLQPGIFKKILPALQTEIDKGSDINGRDNNLNTPLHFTSFWGNTRAMRLAGGRGRPEHQYRKWANPASSGG